MSGPLNGNDNGSLTSWLLKALAAGILALATLALADNRNQTQTNAVNITDHDRRIQRLEDHYAAIEAQLKDIHDDVGNINEYLRDHPQVAYRYRDVKAGSSSTRRATNEEVLNGQ